MVQVGKLPKYDSETGERLQLCAYDNGQMTLEWVDREGEVTCARLIRDLDDLHQAIIAFGFNPSGKYPGPTAFTRQWLR